MITTLVHIWVKPENREEFIQATTENHKKSIAEPGNLRFDVLVDDLEPNKFVLYEAYESDKAAALHKETNHYMKWRDTVAEMMAQPRKGEKHRIVQPTDRALW